MGENRRFLIRVSWCSLSWKMRAASGHFQCYKNHGSGSGALRVNLQLPPVLRCWRGSQGNSLECQTAQHSFWASARVCRCCCAAQGRFVGLGNICSAVSWKSKGRSVTSSWMQIDETGLNAELNRWTFFCLLHCRVLYCPKIALEGVVLQKKTPWSVFSPMPWKSLHANSHLGYILSINYRNWQ